SLSNDVRRRAPSGPRRRSGASDQRVCAYQPGRGPGVRSIRPDRTRATSSSIKLPSSTAPSPMARTRAASGESAAGKIARPPAGGRARAGAPGRPRGGETPLPLPIVRRGEPRAPGDHGGEARGVGEIGEPGVEHPLLDEGAAELLGPGVDPEGHAEAPGF